MADANKTLITRAEFTSIITPASGRRALVMDGATIELGDTGARDLTGVLVPGAITAGRLLVHRIGSWVTWYVIGIQLPAAAEGTAWTLLPSTVEGIAGFRPLYTEQEAVLVSSANDVARLTVANNGSFIIQLAKTGPGRVYSGQIAHVCVAGWPSVLPGVADGQPVGV
ncbi:hypothetical protein PFZ55_39880 [Streptomyces sp. MS2A]|nr:hypothetical protein [Streptomyces sp. MS2A]